MTGHSIESDLSVSVIRPVLQKISHYNEIMRQNQSPAMQALRTELALPGLNDYMIFYHPKVIFQIITDLIQSLSTFLNRRAM